MKFKVSYLSQEDGWLASIYLLPGCHTEGRTRQEAKEKLWAALQYYLDDLTDTTLIDESDWTE